MNSKLCNGIKYHKFLIFILKKKTLSNGINRTYLSCHFDIANHLSRNHGNLFDIILWSKMTEDTSLQFIRINLWLFYVI